MADAGNPKNAVKHQIECKGISQKEQEQANVQHKGLPGVMLSHQANNGNQQEDQAAFKPMACSDRGQMQRRGRFGRASQYSNSVLKTTFQMMAMIDDVTAANRAWPNPCWSVTTGRSWLR